MKKIFLFLIILLFFNVQIVNAEVLPNNINTTVSRYESNTVALNYSLDISDSFSYFRINFELNKNNYPYTIITTGKDTKNNVIKIQEIYTFYPGTIFDTVNRKTKLFLNNQEINGTKDLFEGNNINFTIYNPFETSNSFTRTYKFTVKEIVAETDLSSRFIIYKLNNNIFINQINTTYTTGLKYNKIIIEYYDNGIALVESSLNEAFNSYNPVFRLIFVVVKGILGFLSMTGVISDTTYYEYQSSFVGEASLIYYLNFMINLIFSMLKWIATMGLLWIFSIITMIIFIYAYTQSGNDAMVLFKLFMQYEKSFIMTVMVNPLTWIYTKLLLFWTGK